ncbi:MAG: hypothetical protein ABJO09_00075 [Hyphomicrobiales bacterium]|uniref:hypothetical protein n=1 Tax=Roseobacteraceae TaxID=2854170 RepID=UPI00326A1A76
MATEEPGHDFDFERFKHQTENPNRALGFLDTIRDKLAAHEALSPDEQAYIDETQELDRIDPLFKVERFIEGQFKDLDSGRATSQEVQKRIFDFMDMQRTMLRMLREIDQTR